VTAVIGLAPAVVVGWLLVRVAAPAGRGWIGRVLEISLGAGVGAGVTSVLYLLLLWAGATGRAAILALEAVTIGLCGFLVLRRKDEQELAATPRFAWTWALRIAAVVAVVVFAQGMAESVAANPHGEWDAFSIWNLKAKFWRAARGCGAMRLRRTRRGNCSDSAIRDIRCWFPGRWRERGRWKAERRLTLRSR
jgi:hypothetical protein